MARFPRERRIHRSAEIRAIVQEGRSFEGVSLRLHLKPGGEAAALPRATVVTPKFGKTAVQRNRLKRRLRELVRLHMLDAAGLRGGDFVIRARASAYGRGYAELQSELLQLTDRAERHLQGMR